MARTLRRKLARHAAERLLKGDVTVIDELAALIVHERREREVDLLVQDIEVELAERGMIVATVESATPLDEATKDAVKRLLSSNSGMESLTSVEGRSAAQAPEVDTSGRSVNVLLRESIDQALIGGFKLRTPTATLDATVLKKLNDLRAKKI
jgi:ATP synthase F1, delta subunit